MTRENPESPDESRIATHAPRTPLVADGGEPESTVADGGESELAVADGGESEPAVADGCESEPAVADGGESEPAVVDASDATLDPDRIRRYLNYAVLGGLVLLGFVAAVQFYLHAGAAIDRWVAREYRSVFQAGFNLAVLLVAAAGVTYQLDRLSGS